MDTFLEHLEMTTLSESPWDWEASCNSLKSKTFSGRAETQSSNFKIFANVINSGFSHFHILDGHTTTFYMQFKCARLKRTHISIWWCRIQISKKIESVGSSLGNGKRNNHKHWGLQRLVKLKGWPVCKSIGGLISITLAALNVVKSLKMTLYQTMIDEHILFFWFLRFSVGSQGPEIGLLFGWNGLG